MDAATTNRNKTVKDYAKTTRTISLELLQKVPCKRMRGGKNCVERERDRPMTTAEKRHLRTVMGKRRMWATRPFYKYNVESMCPSCAAYFYVTNAATAFDAIVQKQERAAATAASVGT